MRRTYIFAASTEPGGPRGGGIAASLLHVQEIMTLLRFAFLTLFLAVTTLAQSSNTRLGLQQVVGGLTNPVGITNAGDGSNRLFITLQNGRIVIVQNGQLRPTPFLDVSALVSCCGERGLLGVAFHPSYETNRIFFINYTDRNGDTVVARYRARTDDPNVADPSSASILLVVAQPFANHNGGDIRFGPDGYLYVPLGDGGSGGDPGNRAQNLNELLGKILRIDIDSGSPYSIPPTNPFLGRSGARPEIWALGMRNPWRTSFDKLTGDYWIGDVGQGALEEIDFQPATSAGGENYGWRRMEGTRCFNPGANCNDGTLTLPVYEYGRSVGVSVTGGYVYRGTRYPGLAGTYLFADFVTGVIFGTTRNASSFITNQLADSPYLISSFGEDEDGELYLLDYKPTGGALFRIEDRNVPRRRTTRR